MSNMLTNLKRRLIIWLMCLLFVGTPAFALVPVTAAISPEPPIRPWEIKTEVSVKSADPRESRLRTGAMPVLITIKLTNQSSPRRELDFVEGVRLSHSAFYPYVKSLTPSVGSANVENVDLFWGWTWIVWSGKLDVKRPAVLTIRGWTSYGGGYDAYGVTTQLRSPLLLSGPNYKFWPVNVVPGAAPSSVKLDCPSTWKVYTWNTCVVHIDSQLPDSYRLEIELPNTAFAARTRYTAFAARIEIALDDLFLTRGNVGDIVEIRVVAYANSTGRPLPLATKKLLVLE